MQCWGVRLLLIFGLMLGCKVSPDTCSSVKSDCNYWNWKLCQDFLLLKSLPGLNVLSAKWKVDCLTWTLENPCPHPHALGWSSCVCAELHAVLYNCAVTHRTCVYVCMWTLWIDWTHQELWVCLLPSMRAHGQIVCECLTDVCVSLLQSCSFEWWFREQICLLLCLSSQLVLGLRLATVWDTSRVAVYDLLLSTLLIYPHLASETQLYQDSAWNLRVWPLQKMSEALC